MISRSIIYLKGQFSSGTINAIASIAAMVAILIFLYWIITANIEHLFLVAVSVGVTLFVQGLIKGINKPI